MKFSKHLMEMQATEKEPIISINTNQGDFTEATKIQRSS